MNRLDRDEETALKANHIQPKSQTARKRLVDILFVLIERRKNESSKKIFHLGGLGPLVFAMVKTATVVLVCIHPFCQGVSPLIPIPMLITLSLKLQGKKTNTGRNRAGPPRWKFFAIFILPSFH